jgi:hypothetical protein
LISTYLFVRTLKFIGLALFAAGIAGTFGAVDATGRRRWAEIVAASGYVLSWMAGLGLGATSGTQLGQRWVGIGALLGTSAILATLSQAHLAKERSGGLSLVAGGSFVAAIVVMVWKP